MKPPIHLIFLSLICLISGCTQHTYLINQPKKYYVDPPVVFMTSIISFRENTGAWPRSMKDLVIHSEENKKIIENFPYETTRFRLRKKDVLIVDFSGYQKDPQFIPAQTGHSTDHRMVDGTIRFYKSGDSYQWDVYYKSKRP